MVRKSYQHAEDENGLEVHQVLVTRKQWEWLVKQKGGGSKFIRSMTNFAMGEHHELQDLRKEIEDLKAQIEVLTFRPNKPSRMPRQIWKQGIKG